MTKQQEAIRKMADKKLLNGEQKRVLYRLFEAKINNLKEQFERKQSKEADNFQEELLMKAKNDSTIKKIMKAIESAKKMIDGKESELRKLGFGIGYHNELQFNYNNKEYKKFEEAKQSKLRKIEDLKAKLLADIYCLPMSADEMTKYIEDEINLIDKL